jgi:hypothetical protein
MSAPLVTATTPIKTAGQRADDESTRAAVLGPDPTNIGRAAVLATPEAAGAAAAAGAGQAPVAASAAEVVAAAAVDAAHDAVTESPVASLAGGPLLPAPLAANPAAEASDDPIRATPFSSRVVTNVTKMAARGGHASGVDVRVDGRWLTNFRSPHRTAVWEGPLMLPHPDSTTGKAFALLIPAELLGMASHPILHSFSAAMPDTEEDGRN